MDEHGGIAEIFHQLGYHLGEMKALLNDLESYQPPYQTDSIEERVHWVEFCRALAEHDFTPGDEFVLNDVAFLVRRVGEEEE